MAKRKAVKSQPEFLIEKSIPVPLGAGRQGGVLYPFRDMDIGDSIFVAGQASTDGAACSARNLAQRSGLKFTSRTVDGGVRIWRIE